MAIKDHITRAKTEAKKIRGYFAPDRNVNKKEAAYRRNQTAYNAGMLGLGAVATVTGGAFLKKIGYKKTGIAGLALGAATAGLSAHQMYEHLQYRKKARGVKVGGIWKQEEIGMQKDVKPFGKNPVKNVRLMMYRY